MPDRTVLRRNAPVRYNPGGWPLKSSNRILMLGQQPERYSGGHFEGLAPGAKGAAEAAPILYAGDQTLRRRAEVIVTYGGTVLCRRKPGYLLLPGGGVDKGESPEQAAIRETLEEAGARLADMSDESDHPKIRSWPPKGHPISKGSDGIETYFFTAEWAGDWEGDHPDREDFGWLPLRDAVNYQAKCLGDPENEWAIGMNSLKLQLLAKAMEDALDGDGWVIGERPERARILNLLPCGLGADHPDEKVPAVLFDLDGTLRDWDKAGQYIDPEAIRIMPRRKEILRDLADKGLRLIGVTNHTIFHADWPDLKMTPETLRECQERTVEDLDGLLEDVFWCSDADDALLKPKPNMLLAAMKMHGIDPDRSIYVGDNAVDEKAAEAAGLGFVWAKDFFQDTDAAMESVGADNLKIADVPVFVPRKEYVSFDPEGRLVVRSSGNRRFELPSEGDGQRIPYTFPTRYVPRTGVPEPGAHGYEYSFEMANSPAVPEGYEARDPQEVLRTMYGGMGLSENREYQPLDRARVQAILQALRKRQKTRPNPVTSPEVLPDVAPTAPELPGSPNPPAAPDRAPDAGLPGPLPG